MKTLKPGLIEISVPNWERFNPRADRANYTWFRLQNDFFSNQGVFGLSSNQKLIYLFVLCELSKTNSDHAGIRVAYVAAMLQVEASSVEADLIEIKSQGLIDFEVRDTDEPAESRRDDGKEPALLPATYERTNVTNERTYERIAPAAKGRAAKPQKISPSPKSEPTPVARVRDAFLDAYRSEFGKDYPGWGAKENGKAANWLRSISLEKALEYCRFFPKWNNPWVTRQGHAFGILASQYVELDAWLSRPDQVIAKIAQGKAAERVLIGQAQQQAEVREYARQQLAQGSGSHLELPESDQTAISNRSQAAVHFEPRDSLPQGETFVDPGEGDHAASG